MLQGGRERERERERALEFAGHRCDPCNHDQVPDTLRSVPSQGLRRSMPPGVPAHSVPLQWTTKNQRLQVAQGPALEASRQRQAFRVQQALPVARHATAQLPQQRAHPAGGHAAVQLPRQREQSAARHATAQPLLQQAQQHSSPNEVRQQRMRCARMA